MTSMTPRGRRRDCPLTRRDVPSGEGIVPSREGMRRRDVPSRRRDSFVRSFQGPLGQTHTHKPRKGVRGRRSHRHRGGIHSRMRGYSGQRGSLSLPAQMYRGWPAAAVARPFPQRSPASPYASVAPTTWCPSCPLYYHTLMHPAPVEPPPLPLLTTPVMVPCAASRLPASKGYPFTSMGHVEGMSLHNKGTLVMIDFRRYTPPESTLRALPARCTTVAVRTFAATIARVKREGMRRRDRLVTIF